jgi:hypothetical protein
MSTDLASLGIAFVVIFILGMVLRWTFTPSHPRRGRPDLSPGRDIGLLVAVLESVPRAKANQARATLSDFNIRSSISARMDNTVDVMVFEADVEQARAVLPPMPPLPPR